MPVAHMARARGQRSQSMVEFALVAPLLLVFLFGIVDFGRVIYVYVTINQAVNEGMRTAIRDSPLLPRTLTFKVQRNTTQSMCHWPIPVRTARSLRPSHLPTRVGST